MDNLSKVQRSYTMSRIRSKDTVPEIRLRQLLHRRGYRFRLNRKDLPGKPDIVFCARKKVIFVHGCFWHQHNGCDECRVPDSRREYWEAKLTRNKERDADTLKSLKALGWDIEVVWECELKDHVLLMARIDRFLAG